jgi:general secretion pathway protein D
MPFHQAFRHTAFASLLLGLVCVHPVAANVTLNLKDADISTLIATVSEVTGKNFIVDPRVKAKVTVISASPMTSAQLYQTFLAVLEVQGFVAIPAGAAIKIMPDTNARSEAGVPVGDGSKLPEDAVVTHVYSLQNVSATQLVPILRPLMPQWAHLAAYPSSNLLVLADRAGNIQRLDKLIRQMDAAGDRDVQILTLDNASAAEVVRIVSTILQQDKQADPTSRPVTVLADERSNTILVSGDKVERNRIAAIVKKLDLPIKEGEGNTQVVYLRYASAESIAPILEGYAQQQISQTANTAPAATGGIATGTTGGSNDKVKVLAEKETNTLVITAPPKVMRQLRSVIQQLDIQRAQVLVEAVIAEVSQSKTSQLGVDWAVFNENAIAAASILNPNTLPALQNAALAGSDRALLGLIGQGITLGGGRVVDAGTSLAVILKALEGDGDTNVLSYPTLLTLDNQEAKFSAGQEVPVTTGSFTNTGGNNNGAVNPFQTVERRDVGLKLGITPQINEGNVIKLKLNLEVSSVVSGSAGGVDLVTSKRTITNVVSIEGGQILVIGGLVDDNVQDSVQQVPGLGSIPIIGNLFRFRSISKQKRNLMVFLRPVILRGREDGDYYTRRKYDASRTAQIVATPGDVPLLGGERPILRPYDAYTGDNPVRPTVLDVPPPPPVISAAPKASVSTGAPTSASASSASSAPSSPSAAPLYER